MNWRVNDMSFAASPAVLPVNCELDMEIVVLVPLTAIAPPEICAEFPENLHGCQDICQMEPQA